MLLRRFFLLSVLLSLGFVVGVSSAQAALVSVNKVGVVTIKVLGKETTLAVPEPASLEVKSAGESASTTNLISLAKEGDRVSLKVDGEETLDVTNWKEDLVEIEERENAKKITITLVDGKFVITQEGVSATTEFPVSIDPEKNRFMVTTPSGEKYLAVLPYEARESVLRAKTLTTLSGGSFTITEEEKDLSYAVLGEKSLNLFNVYNLALPVEAKVSASTGEILSTNEPVWLKLLSFFLS